MVASSDILAVLRWCEGIDRQWNNSGVENKIQNRNKAFKAVRGWKRWGRVNEGG